MEQWSVKTIGITRVAVVNLLGTVDNLLANNRPPSAGLGILFTRLQDFWEMTFCHVSIFQIQSRKQQFGLFRVLEQSNGSCFWQITLGVNYAQVAKLRQPFYLPFVTNWGRYYFNDPLSVLVWHPLIAKHPSGANHALFAAPLFMGGGQSEITWWGSRVVWDTGVAEQPNGRKLQSHDRCTPTKVLYLVSTASSTWLQEAPASCLRHMGGLLCLDSFVSLHLINGFKFRTLVFSQ